MADERDTVIKFNEAARRQKKLNGSSPGNGPNKDLLKKIVGTVVVVAAVALGYYALYGIN